MQKLYFGDVPDFVVILTLAYHFSLISFEPNSYLGHCWQQFGPLTKTFWFGFLAN